MLFLDKILLMVLQPIMSVLSMRFHPTWSQATQETLWACTLAMGYQPPQTRLPEATKLASSTMRSWKTSKNCDNIFVYFHRFPLIFNGFHQFPMVFIDFHDIDRFSRPTGGSRVPRDHSANSLLHHCKSLHAHSVLWGALDHPSSIKLPLPACSNIIINLSKKSIRKPMFCIH